MTPRDSPEPSAPDPAPVHPGGRDPGSEGADADPADRRATGECPPPGYASWAEVPWSKLPANRAPGPRPTWPVPVPHAPSGWFRWGWRAGGLGCLVFVAGWVALAWAEPPERWWQWLFLTVAVLVALEAAAVMVVTAGRRQVTPVELERADSTWPHARSAGWWPERRRQVRRALRRARRGGEPVTGVDRDYVVAYAYTQRPALLRALPSIACVVIQLPLHLTSPYPSQIVIGWVFFGFAAPAAVALPVAYAYVEALITTADQIAEPA